MTEKNIEAFRAKAQIPELALCSIKKTIWRETSTLLIDTPIKSIADLMWELRKQLMYSAYVCGAANILLITLNEELYGPPIKVRKDRAMGQQFQSYIAGLVRKPAKKQLKKLLENCRIGIFPEAREMVIELRDDAPEYTALGLSLSSRLKELAIIANSLALHRIIFTGAEFGMAAIFVPEILAGSSFMIKQTRNNSAEINKLLAQECFESEYSCSIVRLVDSVCLLTNQEPHRSFTELDPTSYLGISVANLWIPEETERLMHYLNRDGQLTEFEYRGFRRKDVLQGIYTPIEFSADFRKVIYMGHECRLGTFRFK